MTELLLQITINLSGLGLVFMIASSYRDGNISQADGINLTLMVIGLVVLTRLYALTRRRL